MRGNSYMARAFNSGFSLGGLAKGCLVLANFALASLIKKWQMERVAIFRHMYSGLYFAAKRFTDRKNLAVLAHFGGHDWTFVDVGVAYGLYSKLAIKKYNYRSVVMYEPDVGCHDYISDFASNERNVKLLKAAAFDENKTLDFYVCDENIGENSIYQSDVHAKTSKVKAVRIADSIFDERDFYQNNLLIKLDIQGAELPALRGAVEAFDQFCKIVLIVEVSPSDIALSGASVDDFITFLTSHNFSLYLGFSESAGEFRQQIIRESDIVWPKGQSDLTQVDIFAVRENIAKS